MVANEKPKKKKRKKKLVPVSWRPHAYPGDLGSAGYISPRIYLTPASYLLGWLGSRPCISFKVLERSPLGWIYVYIYVLVILLFLSFFSRREWTNNQEKKKKCKKLEWNGVEKKKEYRKQELDEGVRPPNDQHQSRNNKDKTKKRLFVHLIIIRSGFSG
jgi:hypothetical protein